MSFETFAPPPLMLVFGAVDFTAALVRVAKVLGYRVTVCDAREVFATKKRFPVRRRGGRRLAEPAPRRRSGRRWGRSTRSASSPTTPSSTCPRCVSALTTNAGYIGAMGSRRTHAQRIDRLREVGVTDAGPGPHPRPDRPRHRCPDPGGDRDLDLRGDHRPSDRTVGPVAGPNRGSDPLTAYRPFEDPPSGLRAGDSVGGIVDLGIGRSRRTAAPSSTRRAPSTRVPRFRDRMDTAATSRRVDLRPAVERSRYGRTDATGSCSTGSTRTSSSPCTTVPARSTPGTRTASTSRCPIASCRSSCS